MVIKVEDSNTSVNVTVPENTNKQRSYTIKSLGVLMLMCVNEDDQGLSELLDVLKQTTTKIKDIYDKRDGIKSEEFSPTANF